MLQKPINLLLIFHCADQRCIVLLQAALNSIRQIENVEVSHYKGPSARLYLSGCWSAVIYAGVQRNLNPIYFPLNRTFLFALASCREYKTEICMKHAHVREFAEIIMTAFMSLTCRNAREEHSGEILHAKPFGKCSK